MTVPASREASSRSTAAWPGRTADDGRLRAAQELTGLAWWTLDVRSGTHEWSEAMFHLTGLPPAAEAPALAEFLDLLHPDDRARADELAATGYASDHHGIFRVIHPDGTVRFLQSWSDVEVDRSGSVVRVHGATMDVTDRELAAARVAASEQHFRVAFDNAPIGMSMISLADGSRGHYLRANDTFLAMVGYTHDELVGRPLVQLTHPDDVARDTERFESLVIGQVDHLSFDKRYVRKDGSVVNAWITTAVARSAEGEPLYLITHAVDMTERLREQAELERLALTDVLTGLANRTLLTDRLDQALARLHRTGGACAMLLLDIDRFKLVNDSLGHIVGDALLIEVAGRITDVSRADATVARLGGDEFVVLVEGLRDAAEVHPIARRLLQTLRRPYDLDVSSEPLTVTVSMGISVAASAERTHVDLYREADLALYRAKDGGRDQYALFDDQLRAQAEGRMRSESLLRRALSADSVVAMLQPVVEAGSGRVWAAEGLARIVGDDGALVLPGDFIDVAEETGLIVELDARMFEMVVAAYARLAADPATALTYVSTNVSARSLDQPGFVDRLRQALRWYGVPGQAVHVELTERSLLTTSPVVRESMERLASLGVQLGLDDFGTGYSALAYLQRFTLQFLKIDRSFVSRLGLSCRDDAVVAALVDLAHAHDLTVVAEGVESAEQLAALRAMGCDEVQGYLLGRPMPGADLELLLREGVRW